MLITWEKKQTITDALSITQGNWEKSLNGKEKNNFHWLVYRLSHLIELQIPV